MSITTYLPKLPQISLRTSAILFAALVCATLFTKWATPHLTEMADAPSLEETVPRQFGDWKELPSPFLQVSLTAGLDPNMDQPYDQTMMRTYVNSQGQQVMLALAWGKRQRQEVKIHRPDLCYVAQGYKVKSLQTVRFDKVNAPGDNPVIGKHMYAAGQRGGEAVSYWMRIGSLYSEDALDTRLHILRQGIKGEIPDGILVRASMHVRDAADVDRTWPVMDSFLTELAAAVPEATRNLFLGPPR